MRLPGYALVVVVCSVSVALAAPKRAGKGGGKSPKPGQTAKQPPNQPAAKPVDPKLQAEIDRLEKEYYALLPKLAYGSTAKIARKLYELQIKATGEASQRAQARKATLAHALSSARNFAGAEKLFLELLKTAEKEHGVDSRQVLSALAPFTSMYQQQQRYTDFETTMQRILALTKKHDGYKSQAYALQLQQYAMLLGTRNEYTAALRMYEEALQVYEAVAPSKNDWSLVGPIQLLAYYYYQSNQQKKAIALYDRAIAISQATTSVPLATRLSTLWGTAMTYEFGNRKDLAAPLFKKAIEQAEQELARLENNPPDEWQVNALEMQLAAMYRFGKSYQKLEAMLMKGLKRAQTGGSSTGLEMQLADLKRLQGKNKEALALLEKARDDLNKQMAGYGTAYNSVIAEVLREMGEFKRAEKLAREAIADNIAKYGKRSPVYVGPLMTLFNIQAQSGQVAKAEKTLDEVLDIAERDLTMAMRTGTDTDHAIYFARNSYFLDIAINFNLNYGANSGAAARLALTTLLRRKGRILDAAAAALATIRAKLSPADKKLLDELSSARAELANLIIAKGTASDPDSVKEVARLEDKIQRLEEQVSKKSAAYRNVTQAIELAAIQKMIPKDARLVELVNYQPWDPKASYASALAGNLRPRRYAAYVAATKGDPFVVELGEAAPIERAIEQFRKALADPDNDRVVDLGKTVYDLTMAKIAPKLGGATNILIAPDGALNVIPFSAVVDDNKQFLIKKYTFTYLTSGRDLLRLSVKTKAQGGGVLFADPKFDASASPPAGGTSRGRRSADLASLQWPQLPGTAAEADAVTKMIRGLKVYRGDAATEGTLKKVKGPKILHLATHGFFLPDDDKPVVTGDSPMAGVTAIGMAPPTGAVPGQPTQQYENPLLRSGLAFAGANKLASGDDDGLLTSLEASGLDLWGTKLVVLSACETGVGKVTNGDGVYGLRRSLVIAGAESLVMSLWQVDDFATKEMMAGFYKRLSAGKPRSDALRDIQLELLGKPKYAHPFYWASFLPAGATTPLKD